MKPRKIMSLSLILALILTAVPADKVSAAGSYGDADVFATEEAGTEQTQSVSSEAETDIVFEEITDFSDIAGLAYGSARVPVEGITYLPVETLSVMKTDELEAYVSVCDQAVTLKKEVPEIEPIVIYTDENGMLCMYSEIPFSQINALTGENLSTTALEALSDDTDEHADDPDDEDVQIFEVEDTDDEQALFETAPECTVPAGVNMDLVEIPEEDIEADEDLDMRAELMQKYGDLIEQEDLFSTSKDQKNLFYNQLNSTTKQIYKIAYKKMVKKQKNSFVFSSYGTYNYMNEASNAISALENTYPAKFGWKDPAGGLHSNLRYNFWTRRCTFTYTLDKSKYYSKSLNKQANARIKQLVEAAYTYASINYTQSPSYGIVYFFDKWICENNYYNNIGTATSGAARKSDIFYYCHRQYGILLKGYGVCESYAMAMSCLLDKAGLTNLYVIGYAGEGHAWNYVGMPTGSGGYWYMLDTTWNDVGSYSSLNYFLVPKDSVHTPEGRSFTSGMYFSYPSTASSKYSRISEDPGSQGIALKKGKKTKIKPQGLYSRMITSDWTSSDPNVLTIDSKGNVKAKNTGYSYVSYKLAGLNVRFPVVVYKLSGLTFSDGKKSFSDTVIAGKTYTYQITVDQDNRTISAENLYNAGAVKWPTQKHNKKKLMDTSLNLSGDTITIKVTPYSKGKSTVNIKFGGKTAKLKLKVKAQ